MWCPKCKNEYVPGITRCADCGILLVDSLDAPKPSDSPAFGDFGPDAGFTGSIPGMPGQTDSETGFAGSIPGMPGRTDSETGFAGSISDGSDQTDPDGGAGRTGSSPVSASHAYVSQRTKAEDMKSTAYTFTLTGGAGLILLVLFAAGILPFHMAIYSKVMTCLVMGGLFFFFLLVGINAFRQQNKITRAAEEEDALFSAIMEWFPSAHTAKEIDAALNAAPHTDGVVAASHTDGGDAATDIALHTDGGDAAADIALHTDGGDATADIALHTDGGDAAADVSESDGEELLYFARYEVMHRLIAARYPDLEESFCDHVIETLYAALF